MCQHLPTILSKHLAVCNKVFSWKLLQISCTPSGKPSFDDPSGKVIAGKPANY